MWNASFPGKTRFRVTSRIRDVAPAVWTLGTLFHTVPNFSKGHKRVTSQARTHFPCTLLAAVRPYHPPCDKVRRDSLEKFLLLRICIFKMQINTSTKKESVLPPLFIIHMCHLYVKAWPTNTLSRETLIAITSFNPFWILNKQVFWKTLTAESKCHDILFLH